MNDDDNYGASWNVGPEGQHPYTYTWFSKALDELNDVNKHQTELEFELAQIDMLDYMVEQMESFPDADEIIEKVRNNIK